MRSGGFQRCKSVVWVACCSFVCGVFLPRAATLKKLLFVVFRLDSKGGKDTKGAEVCVNLVDLVKSFQTSTYYLLAKIGVDTAENGPLKVCQNNLNLSKT